MSEVEERRHDELVPAPRGGPGPADGGLERLRELLFDAERERLARVERRLERPLEPDDVARVLPQAVAGAGREGDLLADVLTPTVERSLGESVQRNPKVLADAIFPIIGPAIRRSISQSIADMVTSINQTVEHSLTLKGLKWRLEAKRARRPFAEVVLSKSFRYRVEQVFLVHRETGLLLEHVVAPGAPRWDPELTSSMLGAIQDFMADSFSEDGADAQLEQVEIASGNLILARGPQATLAAWVRGTVPARVRGELQRAVEAVHQRCGTDLADFDGDTAPFVVARPLLEGTISEQASEESRGGRGGGWAAWVVVGLAGVACAGLLARRYNHRLAAAELRRDVEAAFEAAPGIVVQRVGEGSPLPVELLVDPRAAQVGEVLAAARLDPEAVAVTARPFLSADPEIVLARLAARVELPGTARWRIEDGVLHLDGTVDRTWLDALTVELGRLEGVDRANLDACEVRPR